jgi:class 3 adenylate cyclase
MTGTRRLAAIMAIDVVGYSRLMGEDEAGTARAVREHREAARPIVASLGGRIVKTMGDGLLLEFPSVVAAAECAVAIQKLMLERNADVPEAKCVVYRIGVNLGDVLIEGDDILGEGVNIAARLEGLCEPGGVLISGSAFDNVRAKIDAEFIDLGERTSRTSRGRCECTRCRRWRSPLRPIDRRPPAVFRPREGGTAGRLRSPFAPSRRSRRGGTDGGRGRIRRRPPLRPTCWRARRVCRWSCCRSKI